MFRIAAVLIFGLFGFSSAFHIQTITFDGIPNNDQFSLSPFTKVGEKYYLIEPTEKLNWFNAEYKCRAQGANLATIETDEEMKALNAYLIEKGHLDKWLWISGNDLGREGQFYWSSTGHPFGYTKWSHGQPDNAGGRENCVHLWREGDHFAMNDVNCDREIPYICEARAPKTVSLTIW